MVVGPSALQQTLVARSRLRRRAAGASRRRRSRTRSTSWSGSRRRRWARCADRSTLWRISGSFTVSRWTPLRRRQNRGSACADCARRSSATTSRTSCRRGGAQTGGPHMSMPCVCNARRTAADHCIRPYKPTVAEAKMGAGRLIAFAKSFTHS